MDLEEKIRTLFDKHAPVKIFKISKNKVNWITKELLEQIETRNNLKRNLMQRGGSSEDWNRWKQLRNKINRDLKKAKKEYMKKRLTHRIDNSKSLWQGIKSYLGWSSGGSPDLLVTKKGEQIQEPKQIATEVQNSFQDKLKKVEESLGNPTGNYLRVVHNMTRGKCSLFFL